MADIESIGELYRDSKVVEVVKPDLFIKLAGSSFPHGRIADATYSRLLKHENAKVATLELDNGRIVLGRGLNLVLGMGSSGKTTYLKELSKLTGWSIAKYFEPDPDSATSLDDFCEEIHKFIIDPDSAEGLLIDSLKAIVYSKGNLSKGGVNISALQELSNLSSVAAKAGKILVGAMNLITDDKEVYDAYSEAVVSSINGLITLPSRGIARYRVRDYVTGERHDFTQNWVVTQDFATYDGRQSEVIHNATGANTDWDATLGRATRSLVGKEFD